MNYDPDASPVRSLDIESTTTPNYRRYQSSNCLLRLNGQGRPVAIRPVEGVSQPGSFAQRRYQVIKPNGIVALSYSAFTAWMKGVSRPVN